MGYAKCGACGCVVAYRATKGSRVSYLDCPACGNQDGLKGASRDDYYGAEITRDIRYRGVKMPSKGTKRSLWTKRELDYLKRAYNTSIEFSEIVDNLPGRSEDAIRLKASRIGLLRPFNNDSSVFNKVKCWGIEFDQSCVDRCPDWVNCLDEYAEAQKENIVIGDNKITITGRVTGGQVVEALRGLYKIE